MINKRATTHITWSTIIYTLIAVLIFSLVLLWIYLEMNGALVWGEYYSKELANTINLAEPGDHYEFNVDKATQIAKRGEVRNLKNETFMFNNNANEVCIKLTSGRKSCYFYFNDVNVTNVELRFGTDSGNILMFDIKEKYSIPKEAITNAL